MKFIRLPDYLLSVLYQDDDIVAIDKPYGINAHTNDSKIEHSEFIQDGLIEIFEKQLGQKLHIIHRLDQTTTGVMIFGRSVESAKKYADFFFNRLVKKKYWFITQGHTTNASVTIDQKIVHKAKELEALTDFKHLEKYGVYNLWEALPHTGRNHQIRIHAKAAGLSILGDEKYGGAAYDFLMLHNCEIKFPNGVTITSRPPTYFTDLSVLQAPLLAKILFECDRRQRLFSNVMASDECLRLAQIKTGKEMMLTLDQFGKVLVLNWYKETVSNSEKDIFSSVAERLQKDIFAKFRTLGENKNLQNNGVFYFPNPQALPPPKCFTAKENNLNFEINLDSAGLATQQRLHRQWLVANCQGKSVLNIFAQTCTLGIAAACGNASQVICVEQSKNFLSWGKRNIQKNGLPDKRITFLCRDSLSYLDQCLAKNTKFDIIIMDTPSFFRREKKVFKIEKDLPELLQNSLQCLDINGQLLLVVGSESFYIDEISTIIRNVQKKLGFHDLTFDYLLPSLDFELPHEKAGLKTFLIWR